MSPFNSPNLGYRDAVQIANSAGLDAGNKSMRKANRKVWNEQDKDAASIACNDALIRLGFGHLVED